MFGIGTKALARFLRELGTMLRAGLTIRHSLDVLARARRYGLGKVIQEMIADIDGGSSFTEAIQRRRGFFPPLIQELIRVGEESGTLPEVCLRLADYYDMQLRIRRKMMGRLIYPMAQLLAAICVIYLLKFIGGMLAAGPGVLAGPIQAGEMLLRGLKWAVIFIVAYVLLKPFLGGLRVVDEILLRLPIIGGAMRTLACARFSWSMQLMYDAGAPIAESLERSFRATNNGAFISRASRVIREVASGAGLAEALRRTKLFPLEYIEILSNAEEAGALSEWLRRLADESFEQAERNLAALSTAITWLISLMVAGMIIFMIFSLAGSYIGNIQQVISG